MNEILDLIAQTPMADYLRGARWGYAAVNTAHVLGLSLLVGAITALDLRLVGIWKSVPLGPLTQVLPKVALSGLALAMLTGVLLFSVSPADYAANPVFGVKLGLVLIGTLTALAAHATGLVHQGSPAALRTLGAVSLLCWISALVCGRLLAFTGN